MPKHHWQSIDYPRIAIKQYPLQLAWALTIHKIQGATLNAAQIDVGTSIFEYGQTYVAMSRVKSLDGLYLSDFNPNKIRANPKVLQFYKTIPEIEYIEADEEEDEKEEEEDIKEAPDADRKTIPDLSQYSYGSIPKIVKLGT